MKTNERLFVRLIGSVLISIALTATAITEAGPKTITNVGVQLTKPYFMTLEGWGSPCVYTIMYLPTLDTVAGKGLYAQIALAKALGKKISRVDYTVAANVCTANLIEFY